MHSNLDDPKIGDVFEDVILLIEEGRTMEQEELLLHYELIEGSLHCYSSYLPRIPKLFH